MELHSYFGVASSSKSVSASVGSNEDYTQSYDIESLEPLHLKNIVQLNPRRYRPYESITRNRKMISCGWNMTTIIKEHFVRSVESRSLSHFKKLGVHGSPSRSRMEKVVEKMRAHSKSDSHIKHCEAELLAARARKEGSSIIQLQIIGEQERMVSRRFFFVPIFLYGSTFLTLLILINWLIWSCPVVVRI